MHKITDIFKRTDDRGSFIECYNGTTGWQSINGGFMNKGALMGNHYHKKSETLFFVLSGSAEVRARNTRDKNAAVTTWVCKAGEGTLFETLETHAWTFLEDSVFLLLKSKKYTGDDDTFAEQV